MPPIAPITDWGTALVTSVAAALALFVAAIPKVIGFLVILIVGWIIAGIIGGIVAAVLRTIRFNDLANRSGLTGFVERMGVRQDSSSVVADLAKWFVRLIVLVVAFDALGLPAISQVFGQMLGWLPNLAVALFVLVITGILARAASDLVRGSTASADLSNPNLMATLTSWTIWGFGMIVAVNQIGVATTLVNTLFMALVGALALALGLAFGLGGRETASEIVHKWYNSAQYAAPKLRRATDMAQREAMGMGGGSREPRPETPSPRTEPYRP
ncbi:MAG: small-conductance mechanosensitive ion channel [Chloroflexi bacterium]|nr:small-conductance mechanosensitive ion channel [Chloroflexota bacterium]